MIKVWHYDNTKDEIVLKVPVNDLKKAFHNEKEMHDFVDNIFSSILYFSLSRNDDSFVRKEKNIADLVNFNEPF